ncbi:MAG: carboxypeptidase-like regulatory domain-containing protein [Aggregatilineales bacterium]
MSDQQDTGGVRRVGRKDRKKSLEPRKPLFPPEDDLLPAASASAPGDKRLPPTVPPAPRRLRRRSNRTANLVTAFFLLATVGVIAYVGLLAADPYTPLNPLPPFTPVPIIVTATPLPPTVTLVPPTATPEPIATRTPLPAEAIAPARLDFVMEADIVYRAWADGCEWVGITGSVLDAGGAPLAGYQLRAQSAEGDAPEAVTAITGDDGAFTLRLGSAPALAPFTLTLYDLNGQPLSTDYTVITSDRCDQNEVAVTFRKR